MNFKQRPVDWRNCYVHIPYCAGKCGYCAFYSQSSSTPVERDSYLSALDRFLSSVEFSGQLQTLYVGGGTPDLLSIGELERLFRILRRRLPLAADCEISCELNPEFLTTDKAVLLKEQVTRLSLGVQSFDAGVRQKLMRRCSEEHLQNALALLAKYPPEHFNIDLIYGIEGVPWQIFEHDMHCALEEGVDHLSCYALTPEENSRLGLRSPVADDEISARWWLDIGEYLSKHGMRRYEISNYAVPGGECCHNMRVWAGETLLGAGPSAAGFDGCDRYTFPANTDAFIQGTEPIVDRVDPVIRMLEIWAVNLRTVSGWLQSQWDKLFPGSWAVMHRLASQEALNNPHWWNIKDEQISLSDNGLLFWDEAAMQILDWTDKVEK